MRNKTPLASIGGVIFALGVTFFGMHWWTHSNTERVTATIIAIEEWEETDSVGNVTRYTMTKVRYQLLSGDTVYSYKEPSRYANAVGDQYEIIYKRDNPKNFYRPQSWLWYLAYVAAIALGVFLVYVSLKVENWKG